MILAYLINKKKYALKIFHDDPSCYGSISGASEEVGLANLLNKLSDKCAKFYFGKIGVENNRGGYTISEFLEGALPVDKVRNLCSSPTTFFWNTNLSNNPNIRISPMDTNLTNYPIGGKFFDFGQCLVEPLNDSGKELIFHL